MRFIQPNVLDRAGPSVGKDDGPADQFGLPRSVLIQNIFHRMALHVQIAIPAQLPAKRRKQRFNDRGGNKLRDSVQRPSRSRGCGCNSPNQHFR